MDNQKINIIKDRLMLFLLLKFIYSALLQKVLSLKTAITISI